VKSTSASPAEAFTNDDANAERFLKTAFASIAHQELHLIIDAFTDADRGYFVRTGLVDSRYNPRLGGKLLRQFMDAIAAEDGWQAAAGDGRISLTAPSGSTLTLEHGATGAPNLRVE